LIEPPAGLAPTGGFKRTMACRNRVARHLFFAENTLNPGAFYNRVSLLRKE